MKYVYLILGILLIVLIMIPYFQMIVYGDFYFPYYTTIVWNDIRVFFIIAQSLLAWVLLTLATKAFLDNNNIDEWFDL